MSADLSRGDFDASIKALLGSLFSGVGDRPESAPCPNCNADVALSAASSVVCESCGAKLVSTRHLSFEHYSVIAQYAPKSSIDYWIRRAAGENLSPARLGAEIKYTTREYVYGSRSTNGKRRSKQEMEGIRAAIYNALKADAPMTVRQVFYRLVSEGVIDKTEGQYKSTVVRLLTQMRLDDEVPFEWIADNTRWMRKPRTWSSLESMLKRSTETYRRSVWDNQNVYVEVWTEKDAIAGILSEETETWDVPLMVVRGFSSLTFLHSAAETIAAQGKPAHLYYFGDYDPSGLVIPQKVEQRIREFAPHTEIHFVRVAVNPEQITEMKLPTRPTKKTDSRAKGFTGESVEVDAIAPRTLRKMVSDCITRHIDQRAYDVMRRAEESERSALISLISNRAS